ncbi:hypothetical protein HY643_01505 [Candidatus Woesearchaeota archaeon]|nr:hypothetical protein [Candidatus Woesearchaeota archaeon]
MELTEEKNKQYLQDLAKKLESIHTELAGIIKTEAEYQQAKAQHTVNLGTFIAPSGLPSAPSLKADIKTLHQISKDYLKKSERAVEKLKAGEFSEADEKTLNIGMIYVPTQTLETFLQPTIINHQGQRPELVYRELKETNGWFELTEQFKTINPDTDIQELTIKMVHSWDEIAILGASVGGAILLSPLILLAYPAYALGFKYPREGKKSFLPREVFKLVKGAISNRKEKKKGIQIIDASTRTTKFKFLHPSFNDFVEEPLLVYQREDGEIRTCGGSGGLERAICEANETNKGIIATISASYTGKEVDRLSAKWAKQATEKTKKIANFIASLQTKNPIKGEIRNEVLELSQEEKEEIKKIMLEAIGTISMIETPEKAFVDKYGAVYPNPTFWVAMAGGETSKDLCSKIVDVMLGKEEPLTYFLDKPELLTELSNGQLIKAPALNNLGMGAFIINKKQFELKEPTELRARLGITTKPKLQETINSFASLSKQTKYQPTVFGGVTAFTTDSLNGKSIHGRIGEMLSQYSEINQAVIALDQKVKVGDISQKMMKEATQKIREHQKEFVEKYGKIGEETAKKIVEILKSIKE